MLYDKKLASLKDKIIKEAEEKEKEKKVVKKVEQPIKKLKVKKYGKKKK